jgi:hypothetical protein
MPCQELDDMFKLKWQFEWQDYLDGCDTGDYTYTFVVTTDTDSQPENEPLTKRFPVVVTLTDPCLDAVITKPTPENQEYYLTEPEFDYPLDVKFSVSPDFCNFRTEVSYPGDDDDKIKNYPVWDEDNQTFTFPETDDTNLSGPDSTTYPIEVKIIV